MSIPCREMNFSLEISRYSPERRCLAQSLDNGLFCINSAIVGQVNPCIWHRPISDIQVKAIAALDFFVDRNCLVSPYNLGEKTVPLIKIPRHYLVSEDEDSITIDVPESMLLHWRKDYEKITKAKGILKDKKEAILTHLDTLRF